MNPKLLEALLQLDAISRDKVKRSALLRGMAAKDQDDLKAILDQVTYFLIEEGHAS